MDSTQEEFVKFVHGIAASDASRYNETDKNDDNTDNKPPTDSPPLPSTLIASANPRNRTPDGRSHLFSKVTTPNR